MEFKRLKIEKGMILSKEVLENIYEFPLDLFEIFNKNISDGIVFGCELKVENGYVKVNRGILKKNGKMYVLKEESEITLENVEGRKIIKIAFQETEVISDFEVNKYSMVIEDGYDLKENELELGRFNLKHGAELRYEYQVMGDFDTEYNMINIKNVKYACEDKNGTLHPLILKVFAEKLFSKKNLDALEAAFAVEVLNSSGIKRNLITRFVCSKLKIEKKSLTNSELFDYLSKISKQDGDIKDKNDNKPTSRERIIVD